MPPATIDGGTGPRPSAAKRVPPTGTTLVSGAAHAPGIARRPAGAGGTAGRFGATAAAWLADRPRTALALASVAAFLVAFVLRIAFLARSYDLFVDEVTYYSISNAVASGRGVTLHGQPFLLHPPLFFLIEAAYIHVVHPTGNLIAQVLAVRPLNAFLAALGAAVLLIVATLASRDLRAGLVAVALFVIDPFILVMNSRNLLETSMMLWILLGYAVLLSTPRGPLSTRRAVLTGILFGLALLTEELAAFLTLLPMAVLWATGWWGRRRDPLLVAAAALALYAVYPIGSVLAGVGPAFVTAKFSGVLRLIGVVKTTGFRASGPSFAQAVVDNADIFATTYALMALGIPAGVVLLRWGDRTRRVLAALLGSAYAMLAYSIKFGTLEEQFFYYLMIPAVIAVPVAWFLVLDVVDPQGAVRHRLAGGLVELARRVAPVLFALSIAWSSFVWLQVHLTPDNGYQRLEAYLRSHIPDGTAIGVTSDPQQFVLQGYRIDQVRTASDIHRTGVSYVVISTKQIQDGYVQHGATLYAWLLANGQPMYVFHGATYGDLEVFRVDAATADGAGAPTPGAAGATAGHAAP